MFHVEKIVQGRSEDKHVFLKALCHEANSVTLGLSHTLSTRPASRGCCVARTVAEIPVNQPKHFKERQGKVSVAKVKPIKTTTFLSPVTFSH